MSDVLIIIPAYNEESNIERVVDHLVQNFPQYDYVVVNDGVTVASEAQTFEAEKVRKQAEAEQNATRAFYAVQELAEVEDNTVGYF